MQTVSVTTARRAEGDDTMPEDPSSEDLDISFDENSYILISQMTRGANPFTEITDPQFKGQPYYVYKFMPETAGDGSINWEDGYNFQAIKLESQTDPTDIALSWNYIRQNGAVGNGYAFYGLYFPADDTPPESVLDIKYKVETDQSVENGKNVLKSDILGAYHSTAAPFSRLRFKFYHLNIYLRVNLYVPTYKETPKYVNGEQTGTEFTGYNGNAVDHGYIVNAIPTFSINWRSNISTDNTLTVIRPTPQTTDSGSDPEGGEGDGTSSGKTDITMYQHKTTGEDNIETIDVSKFLPADILAQQHLEGNKDDVRCYTFTVIIPVQEPGFTTPTDAKGFMKFTLNAPGTSGLKKNYYLQGTYGSGASNNNLQLNQGTRQELNLYIPRKGDDIVLIGAKVNQWKDVETEMPLTPDPDTSDPEQNND